VTLPRRFLKDQPRALARRTLEQRRRLAPSPEVNARVRYLLLWACQRYQDEVDITAYCALSNHHHLVVTDRRGGADSKVSDFCRDLHGTLAKTLNTLHGRSGVLWDPNSSFSDVEIHGFEAEIAQWVYVAGQAVAAGLVEHPEDWPGVCWLPEDVGRTLTAERPEVLYSTRRRGDPDAEDEALREARERLRSRLARLSEQDRQRGRSGRRRRQLAKERLNRGRAHFSPAPEVPSPSSSLPDRVSYTVPTPKCLEGTPIEEVRAHLREALDTYLAGIHEDRRSRGLGFLGIEALQGQCPVTPPPGVGVDDEEPATYQRVPRLATRGLSEHEVKEVKSEFLRWHGEHQRGVETLLHSETPHRAIFPEGAHLRARDMRLLRIAYAAQAPPRAA
jgi:hypothetical protein